MKGYNCNTMNLICFFFFFTCFGSINEQKNVMDDSVNNENISNPNMNNFILYNDSFIPQPLNEILSRLMLQNLLIKKSK